MKWIGLILLLAAGGLKSGPVEACSCMELKFSELVSRADRIFIGQVVMNARSDTTSNYLFKAYTVFKGQQADTISIKVDMRTNCAMGFKPAGEYLVFSAQGYTNMCMQNEPLPFSRNIGKLRFLLEPGFAATIGQSASPLLTENEAVYLSHEINLKPDDFSFTQKRVGFIDTDRAITKQVFFTKWAGKHLSAGLIVLSEKEKQRFRGYDAIIVAWRKRITPNYSKGFRKRAARRVVQLGA
ncbi:hypothetical protein [Hymenobacter psychrotolerans]|uniref:hypothetical protein n=1 Tax=Hymenobacter psychrotolerans TaxID=344998 RepID=UPI001114D303|nr:hypothetical protein [Hymenobacter psychrotolerans]